MTETERIKNKQRSIEWRQSHKEHCAEYAKEYRKENKDKINAYLRKWRADHPNQVKEIRNRCREKKRKTEGGTTMENSHDLSIEEKVDSAIDTLYKSLGFEIMPAPELREAVLQRLKERESAKRTRTGVTITKTDFCDIVKTSRPTLNKWIKQNKDCLGYFVGPNGIDTGVFESEPWKQYVSAIPSEPKNVAVPKSFWKRIDSNLQECSICGGISWRKRFPFCPYCGAEMTGRDPASTNPADKNMVRADLVAQNNESKSNSSASPFDWNQLYNTIYSATLAALRKNVEGLNDQDKLFKKE